MAYSISFILRRDRPNALGECPVLCRITSNRKHRYQSTGIRIDPKHWNEEKKTIRKSHELYAVFNSQLENIQNRIKENIIKASQGKSINHSTIEYAISKGSEMLFEYIDEYLHQLEQSYASLWQIKHLKVTYKKLRTFIKEKDLPISELTPDLFMEFQTWMLQTNKPSTVNRSLRYLKPVLIKAIREGIIDSDPFNSPRYKSIRETSSAKKDKLSFAQIKEIENIDLETHSSIWHTRRAFLLSFYLCGMRVGDLLLLKEENIVSDRIEYIMSKTGQFMSMMIPEPAFRLINSFKTSSDFIFPHLSDFPIDLMTKSAIQRIISSNTTVLNRDLKKIASKAGIKENLSMHVARHSFAYYTAMEKDISINKLMVLLGHKNIATTMRYLQSLDYRESDKIIHQIF